ncbi:RNA polymerase sigma factor [uncultured Paraglaciecola sp.]|uniref:RNA polymerase sigma factor n=1 Tax=uncultured Paraglaciecola sp. TaxID=1765024 RepID=UPI0025D7BA7C|nr:RNA polymerase sigma factor [uncultured Paraglaciecola sp.]
MTAGPAHEKCDTAPLDMDFFLAQIEKKAYTMVKMSVGGHADAIDLLQDSMFKLVVKYADKPAQEWKPLFYRILRNRINDWHRQQKLKNMLFFWIPTDADKNQDDMLVDESKPLGKPEESLDVAQQRETVLNELSALSEKQRQCFLLRSWEGLSVAETSKIMGCSQGSVKTHYFRAANKLRKVLGEVHEIII